MCDLAALADARAAASPRSAFASVWDRPAAADGADAADGRADGFADDHELRSLDVMLVLGVAPPSARGALLDAAGFYTLDGAQRLFTMPFDADGRTMWQLSWRAKSPDPSPLLAAALSRG